MRTGPLYNVSRIVLALALAGGAYYLLVFMVLAYFRIPFPFDLDWLEGYMVDHVHRILLGEPIYVWPSMEFVPYLYPPFYYYLSAIPARIFGIGHMPLRLVSTLSTIGCFTILYFMAKRQTQSRAGGLLAAGFLASCFSLTGYWFDMARVDMTAIFLCLTSIYLVRFLPTPSAGVLAGIFLFLAFLTKQTMGVLLVPLALYTIVKLRGRSLYFIATAVSLMGLTVLVMDRIHDGWFSYYVFRMPAAHELFKDRYLTFWTQDLLLPLASMVLLTALYFYRCVHDKKWDDLLFYGLLIATLFAVSYIARLKVGSSFNSLIPLHVGLSLVSGLSAAWVLSRNKIGAKKVFPAAVILMSLVCLIHFGRVYYNPVTCLPPERGRQAGEALLHRIAAFDGNVWMMDGGSYTARANKKGGPHIYAIYDLLSDTKMSNAMKKAFLQPIRNKDFSAIILDPSRAPAVLEKFYRRQSPDMEIILRQAHGTWMFKKETVYVPVE